MLRVFLLTVLSTSMFVTTSLTAQQSFSVDQSVQNDAFIRVVWNLPASCFQSPANPALPNPNGVYIELRANGQAVYSEVVQGLQAGGYSNVYDHYVGPSITFTYTLHLFRVGNGEPVAACTNQTANGTTIAFRPPVQVSASDATSINSVTVQWTNKSHLSTNFLVVRKYANEETILASIPGSSVIDSVFSYVDSFSVTNTRSLVNGVPYTYCIRTVSSLANTIFSEQSYSVCNEGRTAATNFVASNLSFPDKVSLSWSDMSAFATQIAIRRDGELIKTFEDQSVTNFEDTDPTYGKPSVYSLQLIGEDGDLVLEDTAVGSVNAIGMISGFVRTAQGVGIANVRVRYEVQIDDQLVRDSILTDYTGRYSFNDLYYGRRAIFTITASRSLAQGVSASISPNRVVNILDNETPKRTDVNFRYATALASGTDRITLSQFEGQAVTDKIDFSWSYSSTASVTHFQLYREGQLVAIADDSSGGVNMMSDVDGQPGANYIYELRAYSIRNDSVVMASTKDTLAFPVLEQPTQLAVQANYDASSKGVLTLTWSHNSTNFGGFNIYRGVQLIGTVDTATRRFTDYTGEPGASYRYSITTKRVVGNETFESVPVLAPTANFPSFIGIVNLASFTDYAPNTIKISWGLPFSVDTTDYFSGFAIYRNGRQIGRILKGGTYEFIDLQGIPNVSYLYRIQPYVKLSDTTYYSSTNIGLVATFPAIPRPAFHPTLGIELTPGRVKINIDPSYNLSNQNYDGFILYSNGQILDTLQRHETFTYHYPTAAGNVIYTLVAFRNIGGQIFISSAATALRSVTVASSTLEAPGNVEASKDFPMHVALTWTYPTYKLSSFIIYRDNLALDTLPTTARAYYDYATVPGVTHEYQVRALFDGTVSIPGYDCGRRRNLGVLLGQVFSSKNSENVDSLELRMLNGAATVGRVFTNKAGFYIIENLPYDNGQSSLSLQIQEAGRTIALSSATQVIAEAPIRNRKVTQNYSDQFSPVNYPPLPSRDTLVNILEVVAQPYIFQRQVAISWTVTEGIFDGFEIFRGFTKIATVLKGEPMFVIDSLGTGGFEYAYGVIPFVIQNNSRISNDGKTASATFPILSPVSNLTATASYNGKHNNVTINWSHRTGMVSAYELTRNEILLAYLTPQERLTFEDTSGIPDQQYLYRVRAILQQGAEIVTSDPVTVSLRYPKVADPTISLLSVPDSNAVQVQWAYEGTNVSGFRLYRDDELIGTFSANTFTYLDLEGKPGSLQTYRIAALLERSGETYQSKGTEADIVFPTLRSLVNFSAVLQSSLGNAKLSFNYYARGVDYFEMMYMVRYTDAGGTQRDSTLTFTYFYSELINNQLNFIDELAIPGARVEFMIRAVSVRRGVAYYSPYSQAVLTPYPSPPTPSNFQATDGTYDNRVELSWQLPFEANVDFFEIRRNGTAIDTIDGGKRTYSDLFNQLGNSPGGTVTYTIVPLRFDYNVYFRGNSAQDTGWPSILRATINEIADPNVTATYGWALAADQQRLVIGSPSADSNAGRCTFVSYTNGQWTVSNSFSGTNIFPGNPSIGARSYGYSLDMHGNNVIIGAPSAFGNRGLVINSLFSSPASVHISGNSFGDVSATAERRGDVVANTSNRLYMTYQIPSQPVRVYGGTLGSTPPNFGFTYIGTQNASTNPGNLRYVSMDATDTYVVAGATTQTAGEEGLIDIYRRNGESLSLHRNIIGEENGNNFGVSVAMHGNLLAVGANKKGSGHVYIYQITESSPFAQQIQLLPSPIVLNSDAQFGNSVAMSSDFLLVGARGSRDLNQTNINSGLVFLYRRQGNTFEYVETLNIPGGRATNGAQYGFDVAINNEAFFVGAPYLNNKGAVFYYSTDLLELWNERLSAVTATDGQFSNRTNIQWTFNGNREYINGFKIYRDNELLATVAGSESIYQDTDGIPGKEYTYKVTVVTVADRESLPKSDKGYRKGAGVFEGDVITAVGGSPVPGVLITAEAIVSGEKFVYTTVTDNNGHFYVSGVYYADETVTYTLTASFEGHEFQVNPISSSISPQNSIKSNIIFVDKTAYIASGVVRHEGVNCGMKGITVRLFNRFNDGSEVMESTTTDDNGFYSFVLRPSQVRLEEIRVVIDSVNYILDELGNIKDSVNYRFVAQHTLNGASTLSGNAGISITSLATLPREFTLNFTNVLSYPVEFYVTTVCGSPASNNGAFTIEVSTLDGCYQRRATTGAFNGRVTINLPPINDLLISVVEAAPTTVQNLLVVDYLRYRPSTLHLWDIHKNNFSGLYTAAELDSLTFSAIVYHRPPAITVANDFGSWAQCANSNLPRLLTQNRYYSIRLDVRETHLGNSCIVNDGYLVVNNAAAQDNIRDTLYFLPAINQFEIHNFKAGQPNLVSPYAKSISVKYFSANHDYLGEYTVPVIIIGAAQLPGSDVIVDIKDEQGQIKMPVYILRDPPGDASFSSIEEGTSFTKSITTTSELSLGGGFLTENDFTASTVGGFLNINLRGGDGTASENTQEIDFTTRQTISTSSDANFIGPSADVIVGIGAAVQYGLVEEIQYDETSCEITKVQRMSVSPNRIKTDWYFTVGQINQLVAERRSQAAAALRGEYEIQVGGILLTPDETAARLNTEADNWALVLDYHAKQSVPFYQLCAKRMDPAELWGEVIFYGKNEEYNRGIGVFGIDPLLSPAIAPPNFVRRVNKAKEARNQFCTDPSVGRYDGENYILLNDVSQITFDSDLALKYEKASTAVDYWLDSLYLTIDDVQSRLNAQESQALFPRVENTTFSAGVDISKSSTVSKSTTSTSTQKGYFDLLAQGGILFQYRQGVGFGFTTEVASVTSRIGVQFELQHSWSSSYYSSNSSESTVSYTLSDLDLGDQFSVTAIKSRDFGHSPYFQLLGGRTSCPPEPGTIYRDECEIALWDAETGSTSSTAELRNQDPNGTATFYIQLTNLSPFGEARDLYVYHDGPSNVNGARLKLGGQDLGGGNYDGLSYAFVNPNQPVILPLEVIPTPGVYSYENIYIVSRPQCSDGDLLTTSPEVRDTVTISAYFEHPCSDITIASPGNDWLIRRRNSLSQNLNENREQLEIELRDYDSSNPTLRDIYLEYRRIGDGSGWNRIPTNELDPNYVVNRDSLISYDQQNFGPGQIPKFFLIWDITERYNQYPDGIYEVRAVASCGTAGVVQSNIIRGQIRRQTSDVFALTQPSDGVWQLGDEISIRINKEIDCNRIGSSQFRVLDSSGAPVAGVVACFYDNNTLIFQPTESSLLSYDREELTAVVVGLVDETGNVYPDTFRWRFTVVARDIYVDNDVLQTTIYQGSEGLLTTNVFRNSASPVSYVVDDLDNHPWISTTPSSSSINSPLGQSLVFRIDGSVLPIGDTTATLVVRSTSGLINQGADTIRVYVKVIATPPSWEFDPSLYSQNMTVIANYSFTEEPGVISRDTMDIISAWIGNRLRGKAAVRGTEGGLYASFIAVYGEASDAGQPVEFRVWDASDGQEYNAYPITGDTIKYGLNSIVGSFLAPLRLEIDREKDRARYIPVNGLADGGGGWTWFSVNHQEPDMRVGTQLRELVNARNGDIIKTVRRSGSVLQGASASFVEGIGWISINGLTNLSPQDAYQIYLQGPDDSIRVTGRNAVYSAIPLAAGWNQVGYPLQQALPIHPTLNITPANSGNFIKTTGFDGSTGVGQYTAGQWLGVGSLTMMRPNFGYQIKVDQASILNYPGSTTLLSQHVEADSYSSTIAELCDPNNPSSWAVDPSLYPSNMVVMGILEINGEVATNSDTKVAAFVNGQCRGVTSLQLLPSLGVYTANLFIYGQGNEGDVEIRIFDAVTGRIYLNQEHLTFAPNAIIGNFVQPYVFRNKLFSASFSTEHSLCETDNHASAAITLVTGLEGPYTYQWSNGGETAQAVGLSPGTYTVTITGQGGIWFIDSVGIDNLAQPIEQPLVSASFDERVCVGDDAAFYAASTLTTVDYRWYDQAGMLLHQGPSLLLESIQQAFEGSVRALHRGCLSAAVGIEADTYLPSAEFSTQPAEPITTQTEVSFRAVELLPGASWLWDFGDSHIASGIDALHVFSAAGAYNVRLTVTDAAGCRNHLSKEIIVESPTKEQAPMAASLSVEAIPNPFNALLTARIQVELPARYKLSLLDMEGRNLWNQQFQWESGEYEVPIRLFIPDAVYLLRLENDLGDVVTIQAVKSSPRP